MSREIELNLVALDIEKNMTFTVEETATLDELSEELTKLYKDSQKDSFIFKSTDDPKELAHEHHVTVGSLTQNNET